MQEVRESAERKAQQKKDEQTVNYSNSPLDILYMGDDDPLTWKEARESENADKWKQAYLEELQSLKNHKVYELVPSSTLPQGRKPLGCKPVFKLKRDQDNKPIRYKVRLP